MTNFGASLKKARASKGLSLEQIAMETRISTRFLAAIENEEFHRLPGGIFNRGFVRSYAEKVGLDPDQAVADYQRLSEIREPTEAPAPTTSAPAAAIPASASPATTSTATPSRRLYSVAIGLVVLLMIIIYVVTRDSAQTAQTASLPASSAPAVQTPSPEISSLPPADSELPPPPKAQPITVDIEVRERTPVKIRVDKGAIMRETLQPGMTRKFTAQDAFYISAANAGALAIKINDQSAKPLGKRGQLRSVTITHNNLKDFLP